MKLRVKVDDQSFEVELGDLHARPVLATVDGATFEVWPEAHHDGPPAAVPQAAVPAAPAPATAVPAAAVSATAVLAPIPGVILSIAVKAGDSVSFGQELCVLEAMKMKNHIRANRAGVIAAVCVESGDQVKHGQVLMEYAN